MKLPYSLVFFVLLGAVTSCQTNRNYCEDEVVCETVHRYGVALDPQDWSARGQNGQVVSMRKDGVAVMRNYHCGVLHGECTYTFPHRETTQIKEIYQQGNLKEIDVYYSSGFPCSHTTIQLPHYRHITTWYENGAPYSSEDFEGENLIHGEYFTLDQQLESQVKEGEGVRIRRDGHGQFQSVDLIQKGQMILSTTYHPNGLPATVTPYVDGMIEGERRTYFPGGEPATIERWAHNIQNGVTQVFEYGEKRADVPYLNGYKHGIEYQYRDGGNTIIREIHWAYGQKHGPVYHYIGNTIKTDWYFQDRSIPNKETFDMLSNQ